MAIKKSSSSSSALQSQLTPRVALVYDWLDTQVGGAEKVILALHQIFPAAPLYVSYVSPQPPAWLPLTLAVKTSSLSRYPFLFRHKPLAALFLPFAFEGFNFDEYDLIVSVTSFAAKGIITKPHQVHLSYLLTPTRFLYAQSENYFDQWWRFLPPFKQVLRRLVRMTQRWDRLAARRPDYLLPISRHIAAQTQTYYQLPSLPPLYPPVDTVRLEILASQLTDPNLFSPPTLPFSHYDFIVARHVTYKRLDLAIKAAIQARRPLIIAGSGPRTSALQKLAAQLDPQGQFCHFVGQVDDLTLAFLYQNCQLFLMPGVEDFGITGLEAQFFGKPVLVNARSGVAELIPHQKCGFHLSRASVAALLEGFAWYEQAQSAISPSQITRNAIQYQTTHFQEKFSQQTNQLWKERF